MTTGAPFVGLGRVQMEWSTHDNTEVFRWVLHHQAIGIFGPAPWSLIDDATPLVLRHEAGTLAVRRAHDIAADTDYLRNAWGSTARSAHPLPTAVRRHAGRGDRQADAALWARGVVPREWHDLIDRAIADTPHPTVRVHQLVDPALAERTWEFLEFMAPLIAQAASDG